MKKLNIRGENYHRLEDLVNLKYLDLASITLDKKESTNCDIYYVNYDNKHPLHLYIKELDGYFTEDKRQEWCNKYMHIVKNEDYVKIWLKVIRDKINSEYEDNNFMRVLINSDDDMPVNRVTKLHTLVININHVFKKDNKMLPQVFLTDCYYNDM